MFFKKLQSYVLLFLLISLLSSCFPGGRGNVPTIEVTIENPLPIKRTNVPIVLKISEIKEKADDFTPGLYIITPSKPPEKDKSSEKSKQPVKIASQTDDIDYDGVKDEIIFLVDLEPEEVKKILIRYSPESKEKVTFEHEKQTKAGIFPELGGAGLESRLIAYLINSQNTIYPLGKSSSGLMLNKYVESKTGTEMSPIVDQNEQDWVGCGGFAFWKANSLLPIRTGQSERYVRVLADGPVRAAVEVIYLDFNIDGVSLDIRAIFSVIAGHREMKNQIRIKGDRNLPQIATGLPYDLTNNNSKDGYAYAWEPFDSAGTALIYPTKQFSAIKDKVSLAGMRRARQSPTAIFDLASNGSLTYYTLAASGKGETTVKNQSEFEDLIRVTTAQVNSPPSVTISLKKENKEESKKEK